MVLAKEVVRPEKPDGPPLFGKGMTLSVSHIARLTQMGVQSVVVEGRPVVMEGEETLEEQLKKLDARFARVEQDIVMEKLKIALQQHITRSMET
jgi:hypothetical protein